MWSGFLLAALLAAGAQAFVPVSIWWGGSPANNLVLAPVASPNGAVPKPQMLKLWDLHGKRSPKDVPRFAMRPDKTITWETTRFCVEAFGDAVGVSHCNGSPTQLWNLVPVGMGRKNQIQLTGSNKCVDIDSKEGGLNGASVVLRDCDSEVTESWVIARWTEELIPLPTQGPAHHLGLSLFMRHGLVVFILVVMLGALSFGAWMWQWQGSVRAVAEREGDMKLSASLGGVALLAAVTPVTPNLVNEAEMTAPAIMAMSPILDMDNDARNEGIQGAGTITRRAMIAAGLSVPVLMSQPTECFAQVADRSRTVSSMQQQEKRLEDLFREATPSVVSIDVSRQGSRVDMDMFQMNPIEVPIGQGSGFIWDEKGHIITNYHVIKGADKALVNVTPSYGSASVQYKAQLVGFDADNDIAVLQIDGSKAKLKPVSVGSSNNLEVGATALAIGNPYGLDHSLTLGIISGLGREAMSPTGKIMKGAIQTDAAINPGNSGGVLLDSSGRLMGMNASILTPSGASAGVGFAIPVDTIKRQVAAIIKDGFVKRPGLGISILTDEQAAALGVQEGVLVFQVTPNSAAARAGVRGCTRNAEGISIGDIILKLGDTLVNSEDDLFKALDAYRPGQQVTLKIIRLSEKKGEIVETEKELTVKLDSVQRT